MFAKLFKSTRSDKSNDEPLRWVVLDVETTGLDPASDRLLAIAAIAVQVGVGLTKPTIVLGDSFEAVLKQDLASDRDNILVHHIGVGAQEGGRPAIEVLEDFRAWVDNAPLLAFHAPFDMVLINRAYHHHGLPPLKNDWIDRSWWNIDDNKLYSDGYVICNFKRPFIDNYEFAEPVVRYIFGDSYSREKIIP